MFPVPTGIVGQLCVPFVCRSSPAIRATGDALSLIPVIPLYTEIELIRETIETVPEG